MRIEVVTNHAPVEEEKIFSVLLTDEGGQRFEIVCWHKQAALALEAAIAGAIDVHSVETVEEFE